MLCRGEAADQAGSEVEGRPVSSRPAMRRRKPGAAGLVRGRSYQPPVGARFQGGGVPVPRQERRSLLEHIVASGEHIYRYGYGPTLYEAARRAGHSPGGDIMIHGQPNQVPEGYRVKGDWTAGCIAVTNPEVAEIFAHTKIGTEVEIRP